MRRFNLQPLLLTALLLAAFLLRAWSPRHMAIEHFDEGVYASNLFSDHLDYSYPDREFYAPPLLPAVFEWVLILCNGNPHAVMWVNVVLGTALVAAVYWTTRQLLADSFASQKEGQDDDLMNERLRNRAALAAAALVAFNDLFIQYSRAALTDIPVCLGMTLAVGAGARGLIRGSWGWTIICGILTALSWWTKYNGWLPLAILGAGCGGWWLFTPTGRASFLPLVREKEAAKTRQKRRSTSPPPRPAQTIRPGLRQLMQWGLIVCLAGLLWLPCLSGLQSQGGYAAVAENHRNYLVGFSGWLSSVQRHLAVDRFYSGASSTTGLLALFLMMFAPPRPGVLIPFVLLAAAIPWIGLIPALCLLTALAIGLTLKNAAAASEWTGPPLGLWILLAWIAGLTLTTPLYRPYPRLILPWMISTSLASGIGLCLLHRSSAPASPIVLSSSSGTARESAPPACSRLEIAVFSLLTAPLILITIVFLIFMKPVSREVRTGLATGATALVEAIQKDLPRRPPSQSPNLDAVIYVVAEPGLYYHLAAHEDEQLKYITQPASDLGMLTSRKVDHRVPAYLVTGLHAEKEAAELTRSFEPNGTVRSVAEIPYAPSSLVLLDDFSPAALPRHRSAPLRLWAIQQ